MRTLSKTQRKELSRLTVDLLEFIRPMELRIYGQWITEYRDDLLNANFDRLSFWKQLGDSVYKQIRNRNNYEKAKILGYNEISLDEYGWLHRHELNDIEDIFFPSKEDAYRCDNYITLGRGVNQLWVYGLHYSFGAAGGGYIPCVFCKPYPSREAALFAAVDDLKAKFNDASHKNDPTNFNQKKIKDVLKVINEFTVKSNQLVLF